MARRKRPRNLIRALLRAGLLAPGQATELVQVHDDACNVRKGRGRCNCRTLRRRLQVDALEVEAEANARFADEYDAAQERGEVATQHDGRRVGIPDGNAKPTAAEIGVTPKEIHEARQVRDALVAVEG